MASRLGQLFVNASKYRSPTAQGFKTQQPSRCMSGGHHGEGVAFEGVTLHQPSKWHTYAGEGMAAVMWFWIFVRAYHDGSTLLFGHAQHFEHEAHESHHDQ